MSDLASKNSNLGRTRFEPRSFQEYDPYPTANPVCPAKCHHLVVEVMV